MAARACALHLQWETLAERDSLAHGVCRRAHASSSERKVSASFSFDATFEVHRKLISMPYFVCCTYFRVDEVEVSRHIFNWQTYCLIGLHISCSLGFCFKRSRIAVASALHSTALKLLLLLLKKILNKIEVPLYLEMIFQVAWHPLSRATNAIRNYQNASAVYCLMIINLSI